MNHERPLNPSERKLLQFLLGAEWIDVELAFRLLSPMGQVRGIAKHFGKAKKPVNSFVYTMLRRLAKERILTRHPNINLPAYTFGPWAETLFEGKAEKETCRSFARSRKASPYVKHDLIATRLLVLLDLAQQANPRWQYKVLSRHKEPTIKADQEKGGNLRLDRYIVVKDQDRSLAYYWFLDADHSTDAIVSDTQPSSIKHKAERFYAHAEHHRISKQFQIPGAGLLFVLPEGKEERAEKIMAAIRDSDVIGGSELIGVMVHKPSHWDDPTQVARTLTKG